MLRRGKADGFDGRGTNQHIPGGEVSGGNGSSRLALSRGAFCHDRADYCRQDERQSRIEDGSQGSGCLCLPHKQPGKVSQSIHLLALESLELR